MAGEDFNKKEGTKMEKVFSKVGFTMMMTVLFFIAYVSLANSGPYSSYTGGYSGAVHGDGPDASVVESGGVITIKSGGQIIANSGADVRFASATVTGAVSAGSVVVDAAVTAASVAAVLKATPKTKAELLVSSPAVGDFYRCSDCTNIIAVGTGTNAGNFGSIAITTFQ